MLLERIELRWRDVSGSAHTLALDPASALSAHDGGVALSARIEPSVGGTIVRVEVSNHAAPIRLGSVRFRIATGLPPDRPARFFKHGYQSWSASGAVAIGGRIHRRDTSTIIARRCHQSEATRPPDAPEAATSELFTIVESDGAADRGLAGFIGGASQFTTLTALTPAAIVARALFDDVALASGTTREVEPLFLISADDPASRLAARWAAMLGRSMNARVSAPYQRGWCSWYHYFHAITEDALRANIAALKRMRGDFPIDLIQLDDGFQAALGDWDSTNAKFPSGLHRIADEIRAAGFDAGIWTAPFLTARDSRVMIDHPEWLIRGGDGAPVAAGYNTNWTTDPDAFAYALDASHPACIEHLHQLFARLVHEFGYAYLKLDFLYAAAIEGVRHDRSITRAETLRRGLEAIRAGAGECAFILGCGCPLGPAVGIVDGMRIGTDVAPKWGGLDPAYGGPSTAQAIDAVLTRSFMHRQLWLNDPDCLMLRGRETELNADERHALASIIAVSGGMLLISDDMSLLGPEAGASFRAAAALGAEIDAGSAHGPPLLYDMMNTPPIRILSEATPRGGIAAVINFGDAPASMRLSDLRAALGGATQQIRVFELGATETVAPELIELPPHSARLLRAGAR